MDGPPLKRHTSHARDDEGGSDDDDDMLLEKLKDENRVMLQDLAQYKRQLVGLKKELTMMDKKSHEIELVVSLMQRLWSQLDIDAAMILDCLGDSEFLAQTNENSELLYRILQQSTEVRELVQQDTIATSNAGVSLGGLDKVARKDAKDKTMEATEMDIDSTAQDSIKPVATKPSTTESAVAQLESSISSRSSFTLAILERLLETISVSNPLVTVPEVINALVDSKELYTEREILVERISKLALEVSDIKIKLLIANQQNNKLNRQLNRKSVELENEGVKPPVETTNESNNNNNATASDSEPKTTHVTAVDPESSTRNEAIEKELIKKVIVAEKKLSELEAARVKVELNLTERVAKPLSQTEAQLADLNKALEEVRSQNKARVTSILDDIHAAREKIKSLEMTLFQAETAANTKFVDAVTKTESELKAARNELTASEGVKIKDETDEIMIQTSKKLLEDFQVLHSFSTGEIAKLNEKIKLFELIDVNQRANLANSISRISKLEGYLGGAVMVPEPEVDLTSAKNSKKVVMEEGECDEDDEGEEKADEKSVSNKAEEVIISFVNKRSDEIRKEIADSKAYTDILISEIETVSTRQGIVESIRVSVKEQESSLQLKQREYMDSSLQLHYQVSDAERIVAETTNKLTAVENNLKQMDSLLNQQRSSEISSRFENWDTKHNNSATALESAKEEALATNQKVGLIEKTISSIKLRNSELQKRSEELSKIYEKEKKLRIEVNRELNKLRNKKDSDSAVATASGNTMLSITLGMLHCPVCKLRYKGVVLNKCFHLFCKECIEDVMQKKTKKCPTCGEKINKDDIKTVFFTH